MAGWRLESFRFLLLVTFPVAAFWMFNQPAIFQKFMKNYKVADTSSGDEAFREWKEKLLVEKRKGEYEKFLREKMAFEAAQKERRQAEA